MSGALEPEDAPVRLRCVDTVLQAQHTRIIATTLSISGFCVAIISGQIAGASLDASLARGLLAMALCYPVGVVVGKVAMRAVREHIESYTGAGSGVGAQAGDEAGVGVGVGAGARAGAGGGEAVENPGGAGLNNPQDRDDVIEVDEAPEERRAAA